MHKIVFIIIYFGELPWYFDIFCHSCIQNNSIEFIFFGDHISSSIKAKNINKIYFSTTDFNNLASKKLNLKINIEHGYKLCDFRPAFGKIFEDYTEGFDFWGVCDIDIIIGNIRGFLTSDILNNYDYISVKPEYPTGFFSVFKNTGLIKYLFNKSKHISTIYTNEKNYMFDECGGCYDEVIAGKNILDIKTKTDSLHHLLEKNLHNIRSLFEFYSIEGLPGYIKYINGVLSFKNKYEILIYHLSDYKKNYFTQKRVVISQNGFYINKFSITRIGLIHKLLGILFDKCIIFKYRALTLIDICAMFLIRRKFILDNQKFNYMNQKFEIYSDKGRMHYKFSYYSNQIFKSTLLKKHFYLTGLRKYFKYADGGICIIQKNGTPIFYNISN